MNIKQFLCAFFSFLNKENIDYFVYGEYRSLPADTGGSDIDMVISERDFSRAEGYLNFLIEQNDITRASVYSNSNASFYRLLHLDWGVQIDIFKGGLFYKGTPYYSTDLLKKSIIEYNGIKVLILHQFRW